MPDLELWRCACGQERTWGEMIPGDLAKPDAMLFCQRCQKLTRHKFTANYVHVPEKIYRTAGEVFKVGQPASFWKFRPQSVRQAGCSQARRGHHYATERH